MLAFVGYYNKITVHNMAYKTRKPSLEADMRRNAICYNTCNEI